MSCWEVSELGGEVTIPGHSPCLLFTATADHLHQMASTGRSAIASKHSSLRTAQAAFWSSYELMGWEGNGENRDEQLESNNFLRGSVATGTARLITDLLPSICFPPTSWCGPASLPWLCSLLHFRRLCFSNPYASSWAWKGLSNSTDPASAFENYPHPLVCCSA